MYLYFLLHSFCISSFLSHKIIINSSSTLGPQMLGSRYKQMEESQERPFPDTSSVCLPNRPTLLSTKCFWATSHRRTLHSKTLPWALMQDSLTCRTKYKGIWLKNTHASDLWLCTMFYHPIKLALQIFFPI